ncbi:sulfatase-like hydrolase/transferase [Aureimonas leprariae]|uniref:Sulfatase-like hydrolase/transferase n=1 Tax=Plantimonas leprariae TaxID=2615207 RepID=A0A7V7PP57_9HYPH|nr:sulfatase-like hydrolase/transferase [Aureimonas leprariae]KAB0679726.1 sulfatase-like hydrolase/transferase [Aureimonas leprariae]
MRLGNTRRRLPSPVEALHLFGLSAFAVAQPLYAILSRSPEFFVAHRAAGMDVVALAILVSFALPAVLLAFEGLVGLVWPAARRVAHLGCVAGLFAVFGFVTMNRFASGAGSLLLVLPLLAAAVGAAIYAQSRTAMRFVTIASAASLLLPLNFLFVTPVSAIVLPHRTPTAAVPAVSGDTPVVLVVFDEFNPTALLDASRNVDTVRFPNFASLARDGWWFPKATAAYTATFKAVPAILGGEPPGPEPRLPSAKGYPDNLFTLLGRSYELNVSETVTELCPPDLCSREGEGGRRFDPRLFAADVQLVFLHALVPSPYAERWLPPLDTGWKGFGRAGGGITDEAAPGAAEDMIMRNANARIASDRPAEFRAFVDRIRPGHRTLDFVHVLLPHDPYDYLPDGLAYDGGNSIGRLPDDRWADDPYLVDLSYQRFLLQLGFVDRLLGELVAKLEAVGKYDDALVIVTADHGKSFRPGVYTRNPLTTENAPDLLPIPMFVKLPHQRTGMRSDRPVSSLDILPTIAREAGATVSWPIPGSPMTGAAFPERPTIEIWRPSEVGGPVSFARDAVATYPLLDREIATFGSGLPLADLTRRGEGAEFLGKAVAELQAPDGAADLVFASDDWDALGNVDPNSGRLPVYLRGVLANRDGRASADRPLLAFAVNGRIRAVVPSYAEGGETRFAVMLPPSALQSGRNEVRLYRVVPGASGTLAEVLRSLRGGDRSGAD